MKHRLDFANTLCLALASSALLITSTGLAQSPAPPASASQSSVQTLRVASRLVQVSVIVRHKGAPVTGLTKDDFTILDQNRPQKIAHLSEQAYEPTAVKSAETPKNSNIIFSNHFDPNSGTPSSVTIILMDALNTPRQEMANARAEIAKFLHQLQPNERVALYGLSTNLYVLHNFTNDTQSLLTALEQSKKGASSYRPSADEVQDLGTGSDNIDAFMLSADQHAADMQTVNRDEMTANVMAAIANSVSNVPGRKNLVWVSGSFPFQIGTGTSADDPQPSGVPSSGGASPNQSNAPGPDNTVQYRTFLKEIEAAAEAVNNANLAIYPVDARGLIGAPNISAETRAPMPLPGSPAARSRRPTATTQPTPTRGNFDTMIELAERTGGRAFYNSNDIEYSVRQAVDDSRDSYVLDYYPADTQLDGTFHTIKVEVNRPGVDVRFRKGYFATPDASTDPLRVEQMIQDAMSSPFQDTDLGLTVETHPGTVSGIKQISVRIGVDSNRLRFKKTGDAWTDDLQIIWLQFAADGKPTSARTQSVSVSLSPEEYSRNQRGEVKITRDVPLKNEAAKLRIVVRDIATGTIGSVDIPLAKAFSQPNALPPPN